MIKRPFTRRVVGPFVGVIGLILVVLLYAYAVLPVAVLHLTILALIIGVAIALVVVGNSVAKIINDASSVTDTSKGCRIVTNAFKADQLNESAAVARVSRRCVLGCLSVFKR